MKLERAAAWLYNLIRALRGTGRDERAQMTYGDYIFTRHLQLDTSCEW